MSDKKPRKHDRLEKRTSIRYGLYSFGNPKIDFETAYLIDISSGGFQFEGPKSVQTGDFLMLDLYLPGFDQVKNHFGNVLNEPDRLKILGEVRWIKESSSTPDQWAIGIEIRSIDHDQRTSLLRYLKDQLEER